MAEIKNIRMSLLELNEGQMYGLPKNPRWIRDARYEALKKSIQDAPEMLDLRELLVYPLADLEGHEDKYIIIGGNMRYRACLELGYQEVPCKVIPLETPVKKLREYVIKDNEGFGQNDYDLLSSEWDDSELRDFGMELDYLAPGEGDNWDNMDDPEAQAAGGEEEDDKYSRKIEAPIYEITGECPPLSELVDLTSTRKLLQEIEQSGVSEEQKEVLRVCAYRHTRIDFEAMAEYYAHQGEEMQRLMESNALIVIDYEQAVEKGFVRLTKRLLELAPIKGEAKNGPIEEEQTDYDEE